ncbi:hypothetical protein D9M71_388300 [compost metagenome]
MASLEPAPGPATTQWVLADTEPATLAPRLSSLSLATSRLMCSSEPVSTQVWPVRGKPAMTFFSLAQCMPKACSCASTALARAAFSGTLKYSRTASACLALRAWRRSMPSAAMILSRLPSLSTSFCAPVGPTEAMSSLAMSPARVVLAANSACTSPWSCSSRPRSSNWAITVRLCSSSKKLWISWATSRPTSGSSIKTCGSAAMIRSSEPRERARTLAVSSPTSGMPRA